MAGEAATCDSLGYACHGLGRHTAAVEWYRRALDLTRLTGDRYYVAQTLEALGDVYSSAGQVEAARSVWSQAVVILDEYAHPQADVVRAKLTTVDLIAPAER